MPLCENRPRQVEVDRMVRVRVLRVIGLNEVIALPRQDDLMTIEQRGDLLRRGLEVTAVVDKPDRIGLQVLPRPVKSRQLAPVRIAHTDVLALIVAPKPLNRGLPGRPDLHRQIGIAGRHRVRLVRGNDDPEVHSYPSVP